MKETFLLVTFFFLLISCDKDYLVPDSEVPKWLKEKIAQDEKIIDSDTKLMQNYGAWIRYEFSGNYYYEYDNPLSSTMRQVYSHNGDLVNTSISPYLRYWDEKCRKKYIWKAPKYKEY